MGEKERKKRGHDEGGIREFKGRKTPAWEISLTLPPDRLTGVRKRATRTVRGSREQARDALIQWQADIIKGDHVPPDRMTVAQLADRWLQDEAGPRVRATTLALYADTIRVHILPPLGAVRVQALTPADVHQWMARLGRAGIGARARQMALMRLKQMLNWAVAMEWVRRNVAAGIAPPASEREEAKAMSHAELRDFLTAAKDDYYWPLWLVYARTGIRRGEGLGLRWEDFHETRKRLRIARAVTLIKGEGGKARPQISEVKSKAARRTIDLDDATVRALVAHHAARNAEKHLHANGHDHDQLIFPTAIGTPIRPDAIYKPFRRICADAGLDPAEWTVHHLRHSHASHLLLAGVPIIEVSRRLGHANPSITLQLYSHYVNDHAGMSVGAIEDIASRYPVAPALRSGLVGEPSPEFPAEDA
jgi:integrase